jgi:tetratricopeptide (TPR) repeat protein
MACGSSRGSFLTLLAGEVYVLKRFATRETFMAELSLDEAPRKAREHFERGFAAFERGNLDYAMDMFQAALDLAPQLLRARKFLRAASIKKYRTTKSNAVTKAMASIQGAPVMIQVSSQLKKKPLEALKGSEKLLRLDPLNVSFINKSCEAAVAAGLPEVAIMNLEVAKENFPADVKVLEWLGRLYHEAGRFHDARLIAEEILALRPTDPKAIKALKDATALDTMQKGGWSEAGSYRDIMKDTSEAGLLEKASKAVKTTSDIDVLIQESLEKIQREPQNVNYRRGLAELYARTERFDEALDTLAEAQKVTGAGVDPQLDRLASSIRAKKFDFEIARFSEAGQAAEAEAHAKAKSAFMLADFEEKVKRYPNDLQFRYDLGVALFEAGKLNEATQQFQLAAKNPQRRVRSLYYLGLCFKAKQLNDLALEQLEKAASELPVMDETKKDVLYELAAVHEAMGQPDKALALYKDIYSVDVAYRDVTQKIENAYRK